MIALPIVLYYWGFPLFAVVALVADTTTSALTYLGTLVAGLLTGAVGGAVITTSHERTERFRERMVNASTDFLTAFDEALNTTSEFAHSIVEAAYEPMKALTHDKDFAADEDFEEKYSAAFPEAVGEAIGREAMRQRIKTDVYPSLRKLGAARRRLAIVFQRDTKVSEHADRVHALFHDELALHLPLTLGMIEYTKAVAEIGRRRNAALEEFTTAAQNAIARRRL